jgi:hypothetical protein
MGTKMNHNLKKQIERNQYNGEFSEEECRKFLETLADKCSYQYWGGYYDGSIAKSTCILANQFISALPENVKMPMFFPNNTFSEDGCGAIEFKWRSFENQTLEVTVEEKYPNSKHNDKQELTYEWAGVPPDQGYCRERFDRQHIPPRLLFEIQQITKLRQKEQTP